MKNDLGSHVGVSLWSDRFAPTGTHDELFTPYTSPRHSRFRRVNSSNPHRFSSTPSHPMNSDRLPRLFPDLHRSKGSPPHTRSHRRSTQTPSPPGGCKERTRRPLKRGNGTLPTVDPTTMVFRPPTPATNAPTPSNTPVLHPSLGTYVGHLDRTPGGSRSFL